MSYRTSANEALDGGPVRRTSSFYGNREFKPTGRERRCRQEWVVRHSHAMRRRASAEA
jgi:hypothetical protein